MLLGFRVAQTPADCLDLKHIKPNQHTASDRTYSTKEGVIICEGPWVEPPMAFLLLLLLLLLCVPTKHSVLRTTLA